MKLEKASVKNFRCVDDSNEFTLGSVTCLVGKNESGKSTLLLALEHLNPYDPSRANFDRLVDFPRKRLADYEELYPGSDANVLETFWSLDQPEVDAVEKQFGSGVLKERVICIRNRSTNRPLGRFFSRPELHFQAGHRPAAGPQ